MDSMIRTFKALSDPGRIRILRMLEVKPLCVCEITSVLGLAVSTVSKHLSILKAAGFITDRKEQKWVEYRLIDNPDSVLTSTLLTLIRQESEKKAIAVMEQKHAEKVDRLVLCGPVKSEYKE